MKNHNCILGMLGLVGVFALSVSQSANANLITNGDFETGDFTGWTVTKAAFESIIFVDHGPGPDTTFGAFFGATSTDFDAISQTFVTTPGALYTLSFFHQVVNTKFPADNEFRVLFAGAVVFDNLNANPGFGTFTFNLQAIGPLTTLEFEGRNFPAFDFLDNVSVQAAPDAGSSALLLGLAVTGLVFIRRALFRSALH
jgi:hypothetical protein